VKFEVEAAQPKSQLDYRGRGASTLNLTRPRRLHFTINFNMKNNSADHGIIIMNKASTRPNPLKKE
jgi:hypothetical protein